MDSWRPTDEELIEYAALYGARGVFQRARDSGIDDMRAEMARVEKFTDDIADICRKLGFSGAGLGKERAILDALGALQREITK